MRNPRNQMPRSRWGLGCGCAFAIVFLIGLGVAAFILFRARLTGEVLSTWISAPVTDQQAEVNQPLTVLAGAAYPSGMSRVEVYADGALILAKDNTGQGETELSVTGTWMPLTTGSHVLLARGYASDDRYTDSEVVYVDVTEPLESVTIDVDSLPRQEGAQPPSLDVLAQYLGTTPEELARRNPGTDPSAPLPPGSRVEAPRPPSSPPSQSSPPPPRPGNPAAPTDLSGTADCTSAFLTWRASPDAQTYRVYRYVLGASRRDPVATGLTDTNYTDTLTSTLPGTTYLYEVASVRNGQEGFSPVFRVTTPAGCTTIGAPPGADLMLTAAMVDTDSTWEGIYCYIAVNDEARNHIPEGDLSYLPPEASNSKYYNLTRLPGGGRWYLPSQQPTSPVTFFSECWGRRGPNSTLLGSFLVSHPQAEWNGRLLTASGGAYRFTYCLGPSSTPCTPTVPGVATTSRDLSGTFTVSLAIPPPTNLRRAASTEWYCTFGGCPQTVLWDWTETPFVPESSLTGYTVFRITYDALTGRMLMTNWWDVNRRDGSLPKRFLPDERDLYCGQRVMYRVLARQAALRSALSDPISFWTTRCASAASVMITFDTLQVGPVNDTGEEYFMGIPDPARIADLEIQGYIYTVDVRADTQASSIRQSGVTDSSHVYSAYTLGQGTSRWSTLVNINSFSTLVLNNSQTLTIGAAINEVDTEWTRTVIRSITPWCVGEVVLRARSLEAWGNLNEPFTINGGNAEASCIITGRAVGTPVR